MKETISIFFYSLLSRFQEIIFIKIQSLIFYELCFYRNSNTLLHFVAFFHVASLLTTGQKIGGAQLKSSRAGQQNIFFIFQPDFNIETSPKNATKHYVA